MTTGSSPLVEALDDSVSATVRRATKSALGRAALETGLHRRILRDRALVLCFHSVDFTGPTPLVCPPAVFERYCRLLSTWFVPATLDELLDRLRDGRDVSRLAVVTFDDGYLDNYSVAAPILERYGMSATIFTATDFVGSNHQAWWDRERGLKSRWMSWDQARDLHARGFSIGAHTRTHADLGAIAFDEARAEIDASVDTIARELGERPTLFAYPFGARENITDDVRAYVRSSQLRCCPSSVGGLVTPATDPFELPRIPITPWFADEWQFAFEVLRLRHRPMALHSISQPG